MTVLISYFLHHYNSYTSFMSASDTMLLNDNKHFGLFLVIKGKGFNISWWNRDGGNKDHLTYWEWWRKDLFVLHLTGTWGGLGLAVYLWPTVSAVEVGTGGSASLITCASAYLEPGWPWTFLSPHGSSFSCDCPHGLAFYSMVISEEPDFINVLWLPLKQLFLFQIKILWVWVHEVI